MFVKVIMPTISSSDIYRQKIATGHVVDLELFLEAPFASQLLLLMNFNIYAGWSFSLCDNMQIIKKLSGVNVSWDFVICHKDNEKINAVKNPDNVLKMNQRLCIWLTATHTKSLSQTKQA